MENTENINQIFRDKNYELTSTNETQNTTIQNQNATIQIFKQNILIKKKPVEETLFYPVYCFTPTEPEYF